MANKYGKNPSVDFAPEKLMSFGKSFAMLNGQPLTNKEVWYDKTDADAFAASAASYVGQKVVVIDESNKTVTHYSVTIDGTLEPIVDMDAITEKIDNITEDIKKNQIPVDDKTIVRDTSDSHDVQEYRLAGIDELSFTPYEDENNTKPEYKAKLTEDGLKWYENPVNDSNVFETKDNSLDNKAPTFTLKGVSELKFDGEVKPIYQAQMTEKGLQWAKLSSTTVEGLSGEITELSNKHDADISRLEAEIDGKADVGHSHEEYLVSVDELNDDDENLKTYKFKQGATEIAKINIPKDFLVKNAEIVTFSSDKDAKDTTGLTDAVAGKYIKFTINTKDKQDNAADNNTTVLWLNVNELIDVYTSGSNQDKDDVIIEISSENKITAKLGNTVNTKFNDIDDKFKNTITDIKASAAGKFKYTKNGVDAEITVLELVDSSTGISNTEDASDEKPVTEKVIAMNLETINDDISKKYNDLLAALTVERI